MNVNDVVAAAMSLTDEERWEVLERLLDSVDPGDEQLTDGEWAGAWLPEVEARMAEAVTDPHALVDGDVVFADLRRKYASKK